MLLSGFGHKVPPKSCLAFLLDVVLKNASLLSPFFHANRGKLGVPGNEAKKDIYIYYVF